jgi:hypothetical protein
LACPSIHVGRSGPPDDLPPSHRVGQVAALAGIRDEFERAALDDDD